MSNPPATITIELDVWAWSDHDMDATIADLRKLLGSRQTNTPYQPRQGSKVCGAHISLRELSLRVNDREEQYDPADPLDWHGGQEWPSGGRDPKNNPPG